MKKKKKEIKKVTQELYSCLPDLSPFIQCTTPPIDKQQSGRFIVIDIMSLSERISQEIQQRLQYGYEPKYIEFILPDEIMGLKVIK